MANHRSALKRLRQNVKRQERNRFWKSTMRTAVKKVREAVENEDAENAPTLLREAIRTIDHIQSKGVIHKNAASRKVSRLTKLVNNMQAAPAAAGK